MSVSVIPLPTQTITATFISTTTSVISSVTTTTATTTALPGDGIFLSTTGEIIIAVTFASLITAIGAIYARFSRVQKQKDRREDHEGIGKELTKIVIKADET